MITLNYKDDSWLDKVSLKMLDKKSAIRDVCQSVKITDTQLQQLKKENFLRLPGITIWLEKSEYQK